jgi:phage/plasmid-associated DNA primase
MTEKIRKESSLYLKEHDSVAKFVEDFIVRDSDSCFTLKDAKVLFKQQEYYNGRIKMLKTDLEKALKATCCEQKRVRGYARPQKNVFEGYMLSCQPGDDMVACEDAD